jgi:hypothetical protein
MIVRATMLTVLGLILTLPAATVAEPAPAPVPGSLAAVTNAYFAAMGEADAAALARTTSPTFRMIGPDGKRIDPGEYLGRMYARHLDSSTPIQSVKIGTPVIAGTTATESVFYSSFDYRILYAHPLLERDNSDHTLILTQAANGMWQVAEDHITGSRHYE